MAIDPDGRLTYDDVVGWLRRFAGVIGENKTYLTELDQAIGDGDHGINMDRGLRAALPKLDALAGGNVGEAFKTLGSALISNVGGASGPLYGTFFLQLAAASANRPDLDMDAWAAGLDNAIAGIQRLGKAELGDKTMLDALMPARDALKQALAEQASPANALRDSAAAAERGMKATIPLVARKGRASYLGERSAGHQDPGATSTYLLLRAAADEWAA